MSKHSIQDQAELFQVEGLGHVVVGALLHRLHRRLHAGISSHNDDDRFRTAALDLFQNFQAAQPRQPQVQQHHVDAGGVQHAKGMFCVICNIGGISDALGNIAAAFTDRPLIVDDEQVQQIRLRFGRIRHGRFSSKHNSGIRFQNGSDIFPKWHCPRIPIHIALGRAGCRRTRNHSYCYLYRLPLPAPVNKPSPTCKDS